MAAHAKDTWVAGERCRRHLTVEHRGGSKPERNGADMPALVPSDGRAQRTPPACPTLPPNSTPDELWNHVTVPQ